MLHKENGRLRSANKDSAKVKKRGKIFECPSCGFRKELHDVEFGEKTECPKCSTAFMIERL